MNDTTERDPRLLAIPDTHGHAKGEHKPYAEERPLPLTARMLFLWFYHACRRGYPRFLMVADHMNYLTFEDPAAVNLVRRALKLAQAGDLYGAAETANVEVGHAAVVSEGLRRGMRYSIGAEVDNDPRSRPDAQNIIDAMRPDAIIRSVHFVPITHPVHGENWNWPFDNPEFADLYETVGVEQLWESYLTILIDAIERLPGHIVGHFYVPILFGHWPDEAKLSEYEDRMLDAAAARGMAVEFNTRFLYRDHPHEEKLRYLAANRRLLRKAKERGVAIAIGSDAHSPRDQGNGFDIVLDILDELEINEIVFPLGGALRRVALRIVREPEPEPAPPPPPPPVVAAPAPKRVVKAPAAAAVIETPAEPVAAAAPKPKPKPKAAAPKPVPETVAAAVADVVAPAAAKKPAPKPVKASPPEPKAVVPKAVAPKVVVPKGVAAKIGAVAKSVAATVVAAAKAARPAKPAVKPSAKSAAKPVVKARPSGSVKARPVKATARPAAKPAAKAAAKKTLARTPAKKAAPAKPAAKKAAKKAAPKARVPAKKAAPKAPARRTPVKAAAKPAAKRAAARPKPPARKAAAVKKTVKKSAKRR